MGWIGGSTAKQVPAFDPMDGWGGGAGDVFLGCERTHVTFGALLHGGPALEAGYGRGKGDLACKMLHFTNYFFCLRFFLGREPV